MTTRYTQAEKSELAFLDGLIRELRRRRANVRQRAWRRTRHWEKRH